MELGHGFECLEWFEAKGYAADHPIIELADDDRPQVPCFAAEPNPKLDAWSNQWRSYLRGRLGIGSAPPVPRPSPSL